MADARPKHARRTEHRRHTAGRLALLAAITVAVSACSHTAPATPHGASAPSAAAHLDGPGHICARFSAAALSSDTAIDRGSADARRRAAEQFGTSALVEEFTGQGADPGWALLLAHEAHVEVTTTPVADDPPPVGPTVAGAGVLAQRTAVGEEGWHERLPDVVVYCTLTAVGSTWQVSAVSFSDDGQPAAASQSAQATS